MPEVTRLTAHAAGELMAGASVENPTSLRPSPAADGSPGSSVVAGAVAAGLYALDGAARRLPGAARSDTAGRWRPGRPPARDSRRPYGPGRRTAIIVHRPPARPCASRTPTGHLDRGTPGAAEGGGGAPPAARPARHGSAPPRGCGSAPTRRSTGGWPRSARAPGCRPARSASTWAWSGSSRRAR